MNICDETPLSVERFTTLSLFRPVARWWVTRLAVLMVGLGLMAVIAQHAAAMPQTNVVGIGGSSCSYATIGAAILAASDGDTIYLSPGTYNEVLGTVDKNLHISAGTADCTTAAATSATPFDYVIDGGGASTFNGGIVNIAPNRTVTFTTMILQNAEAIHGGIVYVDEGATATFNKVRLRNGSADDTGGILYVATGASLFINDTTFIENGSAGNAGGGLYLAGAAQLVSGVVIRESNALAGGGVAMVGNGQLILTNSHIGDGAYPNAAATGGGVHMTGQSRLELSGTSSIRWNDATVDNGGGIYATGAVVVELASGRVYGNDAVNYGGGIYASNGALITLADFSKVGDTNALNGNGAVRGGGIYADGAQVHINDEAAVINNDATQAGGGLYLAGNTPLSMNGGYITSNTAGGWGGGLAIAIGQATLDGAEIAGNQAHVGGGIGQDNNVNNQLTATNTQIISNTATLHGGGIANQGGAVLFVDTDGSSHLSHNHATQFGGGLFTASLGGSAVQFRAEHPHSYLRIEDNTAGATGGGLYVNQDNLLIVGNVWVSHNVALGNGGGLFQERGDLLIIGTATSSPTYGEELLANNTIVTNRPHIVNNTTENGNGGGLFLTDIASAPGSTGALLRDVTISDNTADTQGGGLFVTNNSFVRVENGLIHNNESDEGGGVLVSNATVHIRQYAESCANALLPANHYCSELRGNSAGPFNGGGVRLQLAAELVLENTAVISNTALLGSGVMSASNGDHLEITNNLFTHNTGKTLVIDNDGFLDLVQNTFTANNWAIDIDDIGAIVSQNNNIIWGNGFGVESSVGVPPGCSISQNGVMGVANNPLFHSTLRGNYRLANGSPAVNVCVTGTGLDLDGIPRPQGGNYDMGAFESGRSLILFSGLHSGNEGHSGNTPLLFTVYLSEASTQVVTMNIAAADSGDATVGLDFAPLAQTITFPPGVISQTVPVIILGDTVYEGDETFELRLSNAQGAELVAEVAVVTIVNDDPLPTLSVAPGMLGEGNSGTTPLYFTVSLSHASAFTISLAYTTNNDTAIAGLDYQTTSGVLSIPPGTQTAMIRVFVIGDEIEETDEQFWLFSYSPVGATIAPGSTPVAGTILDDDGLSTLFLPLIIR